MPTNQQTDQPKDNTRPTHQQTDQPRDHTRQSNQQTDKLRDKADGPTSTTWCLRALSLPCATLHTAHSRSPQCRHSAVADTPSHTQQSPLPLVSSARASSSASMEKSVGNMSVISSQLLKMRSLGSTRSARQRGHLASSLVFSKVSRQSRHSRCPHGTSLGSLKSCRHARHLASLHGSLLDGALGVVGVVGEVGVVVALVGVVGWIGDFGDLGFAVVTADAMICLRLSSENKVYLQCIYC